MTEERLTDDDLQLVARHGGAFARAVAVVRLAKRQGRLDELRERVEGVRE